MDLSKLKPDEITSLLQRQLKDFHCPSQLEEVGSVLKIGDGVALVHGLLSVEVGEVVRFEGGAEGLALNLEKNHVGVVILGNDQGIHEGTQVRRTKRIVSIKVGQGLIGRLVGTLGEPLDGKGLIAGKLYEMPLERNAPSGIYREPISQPLHTGIKTIDSMIPIGLGQRQLVVGDRQTGKTTIALDTILNQRRRFEGGNPLYCIYVAIGQKASTVAHIMATLQKHGAMDYTTVVASTAATPAPLQFLAPFAGMAIGEYFRDQGKDALVVFDDLSKQATAYREISLLLRRPPGREAYPGDVFYLHARLLERAAKMSRNDAIVAKMNDLPSSLKGMVQGGGSLTALPIIETQAGNVSAYIPTNVISITDGQLFLENSLFNAGIRPAINVGISVSRVGGAAQLQAMKQVAGSLKLAQIQFLELEAFAKFGAELDLTTKRVIERGRKNQKLLTQPPAAPVSFAHQIALIYAANQGYFDRLPLEKVVPVAAQYLEFLANKAPEHLKYLDTGVLNQAIEKALDQAAQEVIPS